MEANNLNKVVNKDSAVRPRLQSFRLPRDLSLGGSKLSKKVYKPNLNVVRHKPKLDSFKKSKEKRNKELDSENSRKQRFAQSTGVFSDGIGTLKLSEKRVYFKDPDPEKPQLRISKSPPESSKPVKEEIPDDVIKYDDCDDDDCKESKTPFSPINWCFKEEVKSEIPDVPNVFQSNGIAKSNPSLMFWQLPDSLHMRNVVDKKLVDCGLTDLPAGRIGKLCVRKSGKVEVYLGSFKYELEQAGSEEFLEEVVSLNTTDSEKSTATVLGEIDGRFLLNPSWQYLLS